MLENISIAIMIMNMNMSSTLPSIKVTNTNWVANIDEEKQNERKKSNAAAAAATILTAAEQASMIAKKNKFKSKVKLNEQNVYVARDVIADNCRAS